MDEMIWPEEFFATVLKWAEDYADETGEDDWLFEEMVAFVQAQNDTEPEIQPIDRLAESQENETYSEWEVIRFTAEYALRDQGGDFYDDVWEDLHDIAWRDKAPSNVTYQVRNGWALIHVDGSGSRPNTVVEYPVSEVFANADMTVLEGVGR